MKRVESYLYIGVGFGAKGRTKVTFFPSFPRYMFIFLARSELRRFQPSHAFLTPLVQAAVKFLVFISVVAVNKTGRACDPNGPNHFLRL